LNQKVVQTDSVSNEGEKKKNAFLERDLFALGCSVDDVGVKLHGATIKVHLDAPHSGKATIIQCFSFRISVFNAHLQNCTAPRRVWFAPIVFNTGSMDEKTNGETDFKHLPKRQKVNEDIANDRLADEVEKLALLLSIAMEHIELSHISKLDAIEQM
jgi:hypothetical protein